MNKFKTPAEVVAACNAECEMSWLAFSNGIGIEKVIDPNNTGIAKMVFQSGYMNGARYVIGFIATLAKHAENNPTNPSAPII